MAEEKERILPLERARDCPGCVAKGRDRDTV
jgi:hypothetical protein